MLFLECLALGELPSLLLAVKFNTASKTFKSFLLYPIHKRLKYDMPWPENLIKILISK